ncbi:hypothetical protein PVAP13_7KG101700 [Panicum virgatum]|uniref:Uncharacterized protein n=1 Tax=Panicum virgatum TaxID=38727 RepID=A0A8T0QBH8_PANVG|nr:hypothetical protein PVAP13_7KG101700 [Panicum virgatum]
MSIGGVEPEFTKSVFNQFVHCGHPLSQCQMLVVPVLIDGIWSAYMYDTHELKVHIIDMVHVPYSLMLHQHFHKIV